ncbi:MAG TPA: 3-hydroxyacyl-CoA dehydrogenase NAD-binding domain-containing protein [bacterium]|nr:3-hydroxyacyl-CoA dehydrogenase NAD-binding domain-containing protein [bacterium]
MSPEGNASLIVGVLGAGTMGGGIAEAAVTRGLEVILYDVGDEILARARARLRVSLARRVRRGRITPVEADAALGRLRLTTRLDDLGAAGLIIEAAPEDLALKRDLFARLDAITPPDVILASNTSSLSITALAASVQHPRRVVGMHFFNPAPVMELVEIIPGRATAPEVVAAARGAAEALGKTPVLARDTPGFIVNRIARPFYGEALRLLAEGVAPVDQVDRIIRLAGGFPMGPFELLDLIGLDVNLAVSRSVYEASFHEPRFRPHPLQEGMVQAGLLGRKSGHGFYDYKKGGPEGAHEPTTQMNGSLAPSGSPGLTAKEHVTGVHPIAPKHIAIVGTGRLADELERAVSGVGWRVERAESTRPPDGAEVVVDLLLDPNEKKMIFERVGSALTSDALWLTLALPLAATEAAAGYHHPARVVGFATLPPWSERKVIEILPGLRSTARAVADAAALFHALGKETATVADGAGGVFPRIFAMIVNEAAFALAEGVASAGDIDTALRLGANYPRGPLALADEIGLDLVLAVMEGLQRERGEDRYRPAPLLRRLVAAGWTGAGVGRGFHEGGSLGGDA